MIQYVWLMNRNRILVTGVFDLLHSEHVAFLQNAKDLGGRLVVGIESDSRVRKLKGEGRPVQSEVERKNALANLKFVDEVFILPNQFETEPDHLRLLKVVKPDILAVSSHTPHLDVKRRLMKQVGGKVVVVRNHNPNISTTKILQNNQ